MGTALGLAIPHLSRRAWRIATASLLGLIALPHLELGVALIYLFLFVVRVPLNTVTELIGHVTVALPIVAIIVWIRVLYLDPSYEEQAADLGAPPWSMVRRVLLPLCLPAIVAAAMVAFAASLNELVLSRYLCFSHRCQTLPMMLEGRGGVEVSPPAVAMGVIAMGLTVALLGLAVIVWRVFGYRRSR